MKDLYYFLRRLLFLAALILAGLAAAEKIFNLLGYMLLRGIFTPGRLLEFSAIALLFVIVLQLREINISLTSKTSKEGQK
jgi:hypothetical protein